jgi:hypothetical protein
MHSGGMAPPVKKGHGLVTCIPVYLTQKGAGIISLPCLPATLPARGERELLFVYISMLFNPNIDLYPFLGPSNTLYKPYNCLTIYPRLFFTYVFDKKLLSSQDIQEWLFKNPV